MAIEKKNQIKKKKIKNQNSGGRFGATSQTALPI